MGTFMASVVPPFPTGAKVLADPSIVRLNVSVLPAVRFGMSILLTVIVGGIAVLVMVQVALWFRLSAIWLPLSACPSQLHPLGV